MEQLRRQAWRGDFGAGRGCGEDRRFEFDGDRPGFIRAVYERFWSKKADGSARAAGEGKGKEATGDGLSFATNTLYAIAQYGLVEIGR